LKDIPLSSENHLVRRLRMAIDTHPSPNLPTITEDTLLPDVINFNMVHNPNQPFFIFHDSSLDGIQVITHLEFGRAAHRAAHALRPVHASAVTGEHNGFGSGDVVAIVAHTDTVLYHTIIAGLVIAGLVPFLISPRNAPPVIAELLRRSNCHRLLVTNATLGPLIESTKQSLANQQHAVEVNEGSHVQLPKRTSLGYDPAETVRVQNTVLYMYLTSRPADLIHYAPRLIVASMALPPFHGVGVGTHLFNAVYGLVQNAVFPPTSGAIGGPPILPSPQNVLDHCKATKANAMFIIPAFIHTWSSMPEAVELLKGLEFVTYAGGPLPPKIGDRLASIGVRLNPLYGGTEFGIVTSEAPLKGSDKMDWEYVRFAERTKIRWAPLGDGTFEPQFLACDTHRPVVFNLPDDEGYKTSDIFKPHPTKHDLWKIIGRVDDVIIHSSGLKTVPGPMEVIITSNPLVQGAIVFGREREWTGVIIEVIPENAVDISNRDQVELLRNKLWPTIEEANNAAPTYSKIFKEMILFTSKEKPLPRAGKGTVMRKAALELYKPECSAIYDSFHVPSNSGDLSVPTSWDFATDIESWLMHEADEISSGKCTSSEKNLFDQGFDSLSATVLRARIIRAMRASQDTVTIQAAQSLDQNLVYNAPTIKQLSVLIISSHQPGSTIQSFNRADAIEQLIKKYTSDFVPIDPASTASHNATAPTTILITGTTGHLGAHILAALLKLDGIDRVYAFNREARATRSLLDRHIERFTDIGVDPHLLQDKKLVLVTGDAIQPDLGIGEELYAEISSSVDVIIHNAWQVDFNIPLSSYESNIKGSRHLIDLLRKSPNASHARFLFISSIASTQSWSTSRGLVPEDIIEDASVAIGNGYGEGKYVFEKILNKSGLNATVIRLGQVCGGHVKGSWPTSDWFPILVKSSCTIGALPDIDGIASWLPADTVADVILDIALSPFPDRLPQVVNLVHPKPVLHATVNRGVHRAIKEVLGQDVSIVPLDEWLSIIEEHADKSSLNKLASVPAVKLIQTYRDMQTLAVREFATAK
ncbi:putative NRPS-like protein biosynthetic cluster, partial [Tephrocybe sp. NHM501043]